MVQKKPKIIQNFSILITTISILITKVTPVNQEEPICFQQSFQPIIKKTEISQCTYKASLAPYLKGKEKLPPNRIRELLYKRKN